MPSVDDIFESLYLKSEDLHGKRVKVTISDVERKDFDGGPKLLLTLKDKRKQFVANKTNCMRMAETFGKNYDRWTGLQIELYTEKVPFNGKLVDALRCLPISPPNQDDGPAYPDTDDEPPF